METIHNKENEQSLPSSLMNRKLTGLPLRGWMIWCCRSQLIKQNERVTEEWLQITIDLNKKQKLCCEEKVQSKTGELENVRYGGRFSYRGKALLVPNVQTPGQFEQCGVIQ